MTCSVTFDDSAGIVCVTVSGLVAQSDRTAAFYEAMRRCQSEGCSKILVNMTELITASSSASDCVKFSQHLAEPRSRVFVAKVLPVDAKSRIDIEFTMQLTGHSDDLVRAFEDVRLAREWLLEQGEVKTGAGTGVPEGGDDAQRDASRHYRVSIDKDAGIVCVNIFGKAVHDNHVAAFREALRLCRDEKCPRILVDTSDLDTSLSSTMSCYDFGRILAQENPPLRIAQVMPKDPTSRSDVHFTIVVADNRGGLITEFIRVEDAKKWLQEQGKAKTG
jgi:hypothetical protein